MDRFKEGVFDFRDRILLMAGREITVQRAGADLFSDLALIASTDFDSISDKGIKTTIRVTDFIVPNRHDWIPARGDRVVFENQAYIVRQIGAECFRYDDAEEVMLRVHAQKEPA